MGKSYRGKQDTKYRENAKSDMDKYALAIREPEVTFKDIVLLF